MKICIYGCGAIGGYIGAQLAGDRGGDPLVARGPHLAAHAGEGLTVLSGDERRTVVLNCTDDPRDSALRNSVILTLKPTRRATSSTCNRCCGRTPQW